MSEFLFRILSSTVVGWRIGVANTEFKKGKNIFIELIIKFSKEYFRFDFALIIELNLNDQA